MILFHYIKKLIDTRHEENKEACGIINFDEKVKCKKIFLKYFFFYII